MIFALVASIIDMLLRGVAQFGKALRSGRRDRRFKSCHPDLLERYFYTALFLCSYIVLRLYILSVPDNAVLPKGHVPKKYKFF